MVSQVTTPSLPVISQSTTTSSTRQQNFTSDEFVLLSQAFIKHCTDPNIGTNQKGTIIWKKITKDYNVYVLINGRNYPSRTPSSLTSAWKKRLYPNCNRFHSITLLPPLPV